MFQEHRSGPFILGFNGPPRSGKDAIATCLMSLLDSIGCNLPVHRQALAGTMRNGAAAILGLNGGDKWYSDIKDRPLDVLNGGTFRRFMIDMSEEFVKRIYGRAFWSKLLYERNQTWWTAVPSILIITDIGFKEEVEFLCQNSSGYLGIRLDRPGTDFSLDSRGYVSAQTYGGTDYVVTNDGSVEEATESVLQRIIKLGWPVL